MSGQVRYDPAEAIRAFAIGDEVPYVRSQCAAFRKTDQTWGEYSNMCGGFPLRVNDELILTSEALYQACRFPHLPEVQRNIIAQRSPMAAKMVGKPHRANSRADFDERRVEIMWWTLRVKLACNLARFSRVLAASGARPIAEDSHKDTFWGARPAKTDPNHLEGRNVLGRLLGLLRDEVQTHGLEAFRTVEPLGIEDFLLYGKPIEAVRAVR